MNVHVTLALHFFFPFFLPPPFFFFFFEASPSLSSIPAAFIAAILLAMPRAGIINCRAGWPSRFSVVCVAGRPRSRVLSNSAARSAGARWYGVRDVGVGTG